MEDCIFCQIVAKQLPADIKYEDEQILVFPTIAPQAPIHWLIIPKEHIQSIQQLDEAKANIASHLFTQIHALAELAGIDKSGYRILSSTGVDANQTIPHLHVHMLGGKRLSDSF